jgi:hypothetical protein
MFVRTSGRDDMHLTGGEWDEADRNACEGRHMDAKTRTGPSDLGVLFASAAAGAAVDAVTRTLEPALYQVGIGGLAAYMGSFGLDVAIVAGTGLVAWTIGGPFLDGMSDLMHAALSGMASLREDISERFAARGTPEGERAAFASYEGHCARAMEHALQAAGVPHETLEIGRLCVLLGDARRMLKVAEMMVSPRKANGVSLTVVSPLPLGIDAPSAIRRLSNGESAALWTDVRGMPVRTVVYDRNGHPLALENCATRRIDRSEATLEALPDLESAREAMVAACARSIPRDDASRLEGTLWSDGHSVELRDGAMTVRDKSGHIDNPFGGPALVARDGTLRYALDGRILSRDDYLARISAQPSNGLES